MNREKLTKYTLEILRYNEYNFYAVVFLCFAYLTEGFDERICYNRENGGTLEGFGTSDTIALSEWKDRERFKIWWCVGYSGRCSKTNPYRETKTRT